MRFRARHAELSAPSQGGGTGSNPVGGATHDPWSGAPETLRGASLVPRPTHPVAQARASGPTGWAMEGIVRSATAPPDQPTLYRMRDIVGAMAHRSVFPGFDGLAARRQRVIGELVDERRRRGLSQTETAARMRTSQSAVARLESGGGDVRLSTLQRYAAAIGGDLEWRLVPGQDEAP